MSSARAFQHIQNLPLEIYPCEEKNKTFLVWNLNWNWNWNWDGSWNDLRECQKLWGGLCILHRTYTGGEAPAYNCNNIMAAEAVDRE